MRTPIRTRTEPVRHRPRPGGFTALRQDLAFAVGVLADALRDRPFTS
jgi:hypothetical protein